MNIGFESMEEVKDAVQEVSTVVEQIPAEDFPPKLEGDEEIGEFPPRLEENEEAEEFPPRLEPEGNSEVSFGRSAEFRSAREELENAIARGSSDLGRHPDRGEPESSLENRLHSMEHPMEDRHLHEVTPLSRQDATGPAGKTISFGETVEHRGARKDLENAIKSGNSIATEYALRDLAKLEAKEAAKKM